MLAIEKYAFPVKGASQVDIANPSQRPVSMKASPPAQSRDAIDQLPGV